MLAFLPRTCLFSGQQPWPSCFQYWHNARQTPRTGTLQQCPIERPMHGWPSAQANLPARCFSRLLSTSSCAHKLRHATAWKAGVTRTHSSLHEHGLPGGQGAGMLGLEHALIGADAAVEGIPVRLLGCICSPPALGLRHSLQHPSTPSHAAPLALSCQCKCDGQLISSVLSSCSLALGSLDIDGPDSSVPSSLALHAKLLLSWDAL